jgi:hypothetical protein
MDVFSLADLKVAAAFEAEDRRAEVGRGRHEADVKLVGSVEGEGAWLPLGPTRKAVPD